MGLFGRLKEAWKHTGNQPQKLNPIKRAVIAIQVVMVEKIVEKGK